MQKNPFYIYTTQVFQIIKFTLLYVSYYIITGTNRALYSVGSVFLIIATPTSTTTTPTTTTTTTKIYQEFAMYQRNLNNLIYNLTLE